MLIEAFNVPLLPVNPRFQSPCIAKLTSSDFGFILTHIERLGMKYTVPS